MKNLVIILMACMMSSVVASCGGNSNSTEAERIAQLEDSIARLNKLIDKTADNNLQNQEKVDRSVVDIQEDRSDGRIEGSYELTDALNNKWILTLNNDRTATLDIKGTNSLFYGSWSVSRSGIWLNFSQCPIVFPSKAKGFVGHGEINNGYLYRTLSEAKAKNPRQRLPIRKIK